MKKEPRATLKSLEGTATRLAWSVETDALIADGWPFGEAVFVLRKGAWALADNSLGFAPPEPPDWIAPHYRAA